MSSSPSQPATDLREAYRVCEPKPLDGDDFEKYYEPLLDEDDFDAVKAIGASLFVQELGEHKTFFLAGHRGCGKTTQLNLLIKNWCSDYHVIYIEADKTANINNIDYIDIYLLAIFYLYDHIKECNINVEESIIKEFESILFKIVDFAVETSSHNLSLDEKISSVKAMVEVRETDTEEIDNLALILVGLLFTISRLNTVDGRYIKVFEGRKIKEIPTYRGAFVEYEKEFKNVFSLLLNSFDKAIKDKKEDHRGTIFIFDNLDRCSISDSKYIFEDEVNALFNLDCNIIYTAPIYCWNQLQKLNGSHRKSLLVPLINIYEFSNTQLNPQVNQSSVQKLANILNRRIDLSLLFNTQKLSDDLILSCGGNLMHLMILLREACLSAIGRGRKQINEIDIDFAIEQLQEFCKFNQTSFSSYQIIAKVFYNKILPSDDSSFALLKAGRLLQYRDGKRDWFFPHPAIARMDKFKKVLYELEDKLKETTESLDSNKTDYFWRNLVIAEIELKNIRCFESLKIIFTESDKLSDWFMVLGENAAGKTTLLRSIALGLCDQSDAAALKSFLSGDLVRDGADEGYIKIVLCNKDASQIPLVRSQQLHRALLSAFPTISKLKALKNALPEELGQPSPYPSLSEQIVEMIERANTEDKLDELIAIARQACPDNRSLQNLDGDNHTNTYTITTTITKQSEKSETLTQKIEPEIDFLWSDIFVCGYGANRTTQTYTNHEGYSTLDAVQSLFTSQVSFQDPEVVLRRRSEEVRKQIEQQLLKVMMLDDHDEYQFHYSDRGIEVDGPWGRQPLAALSDGYRSTSQWLLDFIGWSVHANRLTENGNIGGILLIDEIEQHLHPLWQRYFVQRLHEMFPNTQIIASTHTPLAASGVADIESGLLVKLDRSPENGVQAKLINKEELYGKRADQVLTSEAFGLVTSRNLGSLTDIDRYSELLGRTRRSQEEENELQELRDKLRDSLQDGENATERLIRKEVTAAIERASSDITPELLELEITKHLQQLSNQEV
jgi:energy-coupling factor transporter ATP-binding protein EcfA2